MLKQQIVRFFFVGIMNTIVYFVFYSTFIFLNFDYRLAVLFATIIGVLFSFQTMGRFVFYNNNRNLIYRFILVYAFLYFINILFIAVFDTIFYNYYLSGFVSTLLISILTFVLNRNFVFKKAIIQE